MADDFRDLVAEGVALADELTASLQPSVKHERWIRTTGVGVNVYATAKQVPALVDWEQKSVRTLSGQEATSRASIEFLRPITVDEQDRFTLPDGTTGPVLDMSGFVDAVTKQPFVTKVWLG